MPWGLRSSASGSLPALASRALSGKCPSVSHGVSSHVCNTLCNAQRGIWLRQEHTYCLLQGQLVESIQVLVFQNQSRDACLPSQNSLHTVNWCSMRAKTITSLLPFKNSLYSSHGYLMLVKTIRLTLPPSRAPCRIQICAQVYLSIDSVLLITTRSTVFTFHKHIQCEIRPSHRCWPLLRAWNTCRQVLADRSLQTISACH